MAVMTYRTRDGLADYGFSIDYQSSAGWRVYIVFESVRHGGGDSLALPYQAIDTDGRRYVDWSEKLDNLGDAKMVAELWAEVVQGFRRDQALRELIERFRHTPVIPHQRSTTKSFGDLQASA